MSYLQVINQSFQKIYAIGNHAESDIAFMTEKTADSSCPVAMIDVIAPFTKGWSFANSTHAALPIEHRLENLKSDSLLHQIFVATYYRVNVFFSWTLPSLIAFFCALLASSVSRPSKKRTAVSAKVIIFNPFFDATLCASLFFWTLLVSAPSLFVLSATTLLAVGVSLSACSSRGEQAQELNLIASCAALFFLIRCLGFHEIGIT